MSEHKELQALLRTQLNMFVVKVFETLHPRHTPLEEAWYLEALAHALEDASYGGTHRLVATVPPRHLKSISAAVALPAFLLGRDPTLDIMVASYSEALARHHADQFRRVVDAPWYRELFSDTRFSGRLLEQVTEQGGVRRAVSVDGTITGLGADIIIIDDVMKADEASSAITREARKRWYSNTLATRLGNQQTGRIISIQQRLHEDDLPAHLLSLGFAHLNLPAIATKDEEIPLGGGRTHVRRVGDLLNPAREPQEVLDRFRRELGPQVFAAQYLQDPIAAGGNLIRLGWFDSYAPEQLPPREDFTKVVQSWDTAMCNGLNNDYSVCTTWGFYQGLDADGAYEECLLLDVFREKLEYHILKATVVEQARRWKPDLVLVENAGSGISLFQELRRVPQIPIRTYNHDGLSKEERFIGCMGMIETGMFTLPREASWLAAFKAELLAFPVGKHDDQVDSVSQFIRFFINRKSWFLDPSNNWNNRRR